MDKKSEFIFKALKGVTFLLIVAILFVFLVFPVIDIDTGYFLSVARMIFEGNTPFTEIALIHNPLAITIIGLPYLFFETPPFQAFLLINLVFTFFSAVVLYKIVSRFTGLCPSLARFLAFYFILLCLIFDGRHIMLEPISVFFQLMAVYLYLLHRRGRGVYYLVAVGALVGLSFLSKQFGLFVLAPLVLDLVLEGRQVFKKLALLAAGVAAPILVHYATLGVGVAEYLKFLAGQGVVLDIEEKTGFGYSFAIFAKTTAGFLAFNSYVLLAFYWLWRFAGKIQKRDVFFIALPLASLSVFWFASYPHYYLYAIPLFIISFAFLASVAKPNPKLVSMPLVLSLVLIALAAAYKYRHHPARYAEQVIDVSIVRAAILPKSEVFLYGLRPEYYHLGQFNSIDLKSIGFNYARAYSFETIVSKMNKDSYLIVPETNLLGIQPFLARFEQQEMALSGGNKYLVLRKIENDNAKP